LIAMKARGKKIKRKRVSRMTFGDLVRKLWQPEPEEVEPKAAAENQKMPASKGKRVRKR